MDNPKNSRKSLLISLSAALVLVASFYVMQRWFAGLDERLVQYEKYETAPTFSLPLQKHVEPASLAGKTVVSLPDLKGKNVLVHFWASWCQPCREEKPLLQELVNTYKDGSLTVIGISSYETEASLKASGLLPETPFTVLLDEDGETALAYKVRAIPQSILVDGQGRVRYRVKGLLNPSELAALDAALVTIKEEENATTAVH